MSEESLDDVLLNDETENNSHGYKEKIEYAGFWIRLGAALIDTLIFTPIIILGFYNLFSLKSIVLLYVMMVIQSLYKPLMEWRFGATLGKMAVKIKVVNEEMNPISIDQSFGRYIPWVISAIMSLITSTAIYKSNGFEQLDSLAELGEISQSLPLNDLSQIYNIIFMVLIGWLIFDKKKQGLHDKIAKTYCIRIPKS